MCCCLMHFHLKVLSFGHTVIPRIGSYSFLEVGVRQVFKEGNYSFLSLEIVATSNSFLQYFNFLLNKLNFGCGNYSKAETNQGRKLLIIRWFWPWKLFKGGNYSRVETIFGNTVNSTMKWNNFWRRNLNFMPLLSHEGFLQLLFYQAMNCR